MAQTSRQHWLRRVFTPLRPAKPIRKPRGLSLERLEDRHLLASNISVIPGAAGMGTLDADLMADGQILFSAPNEGEGNTLSAGALASIAGLDILVEAAGPILFEDLGGDLQLTGAAGQTVTFRTDTTGGGAITFNNPATTVLTAGASLTFTSQTALNLGSLGTQGGTITLTADEIDLSGGIDAATGDIVIQPLTATQTISLGAEVPGQLSLTDGELDRLSGNRVSVGGAATTGDIRLTGAISAMGGGYATLALQTLGMLRDATISEQTDLSVTRLVLQTGTGIGIDPNGNLDIQAAILEAETVSGGIDLANVGDVIVGGLDEGLQGVRVTGMTGNLTLSATGSITVTRAMERVEAPGDVIVRASGAASDLVTGGAGFPPQAAIRSFTGMLTLEAGRDILLGETAGPSRGDVAGQTGVSLSAARDVILDVGSQATVNGAMNALTVQAGRNVQMNQTGGMGAGLVSSGGPIEVTTGPQGLLRVGEGEIIASFGGTIVLSADDLDLLGSVISGNGIVTIQPAGTDLRLIDLGSDTAGTLGITQVELDRVQAPLLRLGRIDNVGELTVSQAISGNLGNFGNTLSLRTGGAIMQTPGATLTLANLALQAGGAIGLTEANNVGTLAAASGGIGIEFSDSDTLIIDSVDGLLGVSAANQPITLTVQNGPLTVMNTPALFDIDTGATGGTLVLDVRGFDQELRLAPSATVRSSGDLTYIADRMILQGITTALMQTATLRPTTNATGIDLGGEDATGVLGLTGAEMNSISAGILHIGDSNSGNIVFTQSINLTFSAALSLETGGGVNEAGLSDIQVDNLAIRAVGSIDMPNNNRLGTFAAASSGGSITLLEGDGFRIGTVDNLDGLRTLNQDIDVRSATGGLMVLDTLAGADVDAGTGNVRLGAHDLNQSLQLDSGASVRGGLVALVADQMTINGSADAGAGEVAVRPFTPDTAIDLGGDDAAGVLGIDGSEINRLLAGTVRVGFNNVGSITISRALLITNSPTLSLETPASVTETSQGSINIPNLAIRAVGAVTLDGNNDIGQLAALITGTGAGFSYFADNRTTTPRSLTIDTVDGVLGIRTNNGNVSVITANAPVTVANTPLDQDVDAGTGTLVLCAGSVGVDNALTLSPGTVVRGMGGITLVGDALILGTGSVVDAGTAQAALRSFEAGTQIDVGGSDGPNRLGLSLVELATVIAGILAIGETASGTITLTAALPASLPPVLTLTSGDAITQTAGSTLLIPNVGLTARTAITLNEANDVDTLAGVSTTGAISFTDAADLTIGTVAGISGLRSTNQALEVRVLSGSLQVLNTAAALDVASGDAAITYTADLMNLVGATGAGTGRITLAPQTATRAIALGAVDGTGQLGLTDGELDTLTAGILQIGNANTGDISVFAPISPAGTNVLVIQTSGAVIDGVTGPADTNDLIVSSLALRAAQGIGSTNALEVDVTTLALVNSSAGNVAVTEANAITVGTVDGLVGANNGAPGGSLMVMSVGLLTVDQASGASGGGNVQFLATGSEAGIQVTSTGSLTANGGNGNILLDTTGATANGSIQIANSSSMIDISAAGTGNITLAAFGAISLASAVVVQSGTGDVGTGGILSLRTNVGAPQGTEALTLANGVQLLTRNTILLDTDPDRNCVGGILTQGEGTLLAAPGGGFTGTLTIHTAGDLVASNQGAVGTLTLSSCGTLSDDGLDNTFVQAANLVLEARGAIGGTTRISEADVTGGTLPFLAAVDFDLLPGGTLTVNQTGAGGNILLRRVGSGLTTSSLTIQPAGNGHQLALISAGGNLSLDTALTLSPTNLTELLLASTGGNNVQISAPVNNSGAPTSVVVTGNGTITGAAATDGTPDIIATTLTLVTAGGAIGGATIPVEIDATTLSARTMGGLLNVTDTSGGLALSGVQTGAGAATIGATGTIRTAAGGGTALTAATATVRVTGPGSLGVSTTDRLTLLVNNLTLTTANGSIFASDLANTVTVQQVAATGGEVRLLAAGPGGTATIQAITAATLVELASNGTLLGTPGGTADVTAPQLVLRGVNSVGSAVAPLETAVGTMAARDATGGLFLTNSQPLTIGTVDGVSGIGTQTPAVLPTTVTLTSLGAMTVSRVQATGDITLTTTETGAATNDDLTVTGPSSGVISQAGTLRLESGDQVIVASTAALSANSTATLVGGAGAGNDGGGVTLAGSLTATSAAVQGGPGGDLFVITPAAATPISVDGAGGMDTLQVASPGGILRTNIGIFSVDGRQPMTFTNVETTRLDQLGAINAFTSPDSTGADFTGLTPEQRFIRNLYVDLLGRPGGLPELNFWVGVLAANAGRRDVVANVIERSPEARTRLVRSWYRSYLGRDAGDPEAQIWVNRLLNGDREENALSDILGSNEALARAGGTVDGYVRSLYQLLFNRTGDAGGITFWSGIAQTQGRSAVARAFLNSGEYRGLALDAYFATLLRRPSFAGERTAFVNSGLDLQTLRLVVESSGEFAALT